MNSLDILRGVLYVCYAAMIAACSVPEVFQAPAEGGQQSSACTVAQPTTTAQHTTRGMQWCRYWVAWPASLLGMRVHCTAYAGITYHTQTHCSSDSPTPMGGSQSINKSMRPFAIQEACSAVFGSAAGLVDMLVQHVPSSKKATAKKVQQDFTGEFLSSVFIGGRGGGI